MIRRVSPLPGLSPVEQDLYEVLLRSHPMTAAEIAAAVSFDGAGGSEASATLDRLVELGLLTPTADPPTRYVVVPPDEAVERLLDEHGDELAAARRALAALSDRYEQATALRDTDDPNHLAEVIPTFEGVGKAFEVVQRSVRDELRGFDAPPYSTTLARTPVGDIERELLARGVVYRVLYDRECFDLPHRLVDLAESIACGEQSRITELPFKLALSDAPLALMSLDSEASPLDVGLLVRDRTLLAALSALFELYWERGLPLEVIDGRATVSDVEGPPQAERELLTFMIAGQTDREIAEYLGTTIRTAQTRVRALTVRLGATTRFQAGYLAVVNGWLTREHHDDG